MKSIFLWCINIKSAAFKFFFISFEHFSYLSLQRKKRYIFYLYKLCTIILQTGSNIKEIKAHLAKIIGTHPSNLHIVSLSKGIIFKDERGIQDIPSPLEVMVGNLERKIPSNCETSLPDMVCEHETEARVQMTCGHAISKQKRINFNKNHSFIDF